MRSLRALARCVMSEAARLSGRCKYYGRILVAPANSCSRGHPSGTSKIYYSFYPVYLEVFVIIDVVESEILLKESIRPTIPGPFVGKVSRLFKWNSDGSIGRCERFVNARTRIYYRFGMLVPFHWHKVHSQNNIYI